jgi:hypothetical protein
MGMVCPSSEEDVAATRYQVLVFRQTTLARFSTEQLIKENRCDTILDYSYVELEAMDFKITYHDGMKNKNGSHSLFGKSAILFCPFICRGQTERELWV